jgi:hypothetical protein
VSAIVLPSQLSALAELGLEALAKVAAQPGLYRVDFGHWHMPSLTEDRCLVCFAGAVMATTFGLNPLEFSSPQYFLNPNRLRLLALDSLRCGSVAEAATRVELAAAERLRAQRLSRAMPDFRDRSRFFSEMQLLAADLRQANL